MSTVINQSPITAPDVNYTPVALLRPSIDRWTIRVKAVHVSQPSNLRNGNQWNTVTLCDERGRSIRMVMWNELVDAYRDVFVEGDAYSVSGHGHQLHTSHAKHIPHLYEIHMSKTTEVVRCADQLVSQQCHLSYVSVADALERCAHSTAPVNVYGLVQSISLPRQSATKHTFQELVLTSDECKQVTITVWQHHQLPFKELPHACSSKLHVAARLSALKVVRYNGQCQLATTHESKCEALQIRQSAAEYPTLMQWYQDEQHRLHACPVCETEANVTDVCQQPERRTIAQVRDTEGSNPYSFVRATFTNLKGSWKNQTPWLLVCPVRGCQTPLNKLRANTFHCRRCKKQVQDGTACYWFDASFSDDSGSAAFRVSNTCGEALLGLPAPQARNLLPSSNEQFQQLLQRAFGKEWVLSVCRQREMSTGHMINKIIAIYTLDEQQEMARLLSVMLGEQDSSDEDEDD